jgi:hypothetical protein
MQGQLTVDNFDVILDEIWLWTQAKCLKEQAYEAKKTAKKQARITIRQVVAAGSGFKTDNTPWTRYQIVDHNGERWSTFHHNLEANQTYDVEYTENERGRTITKYTKVADYDDTSF